MRRYDKLEPPCREALHTMALMAATLRAARPEVTQRLIVDTAVDLYDRVRDHVEAAHNKVPPKKRDKKGVYPHA